MSESKGTVVALTGPALELAAEASKVETISTHRASHLDVLHRCLTVLSTVYSLFGFEPTGWKTEETVAHWWGLCEEVGGEHAWIKVIKYKLAAFFAYHMGQPLPAAPFGRRDLPGILLAGRAGRWARLFLQRNTVEIREMFLLSVLRSSRGMPRPPKGFLASAEREAVQKLTTKRPPKVSVSLGRSWADERIESKHFELTLTKARACEEIARTVRELFEKETYTIQDRVKPFTPSTSANYHKSRAGGGALGELLSESSHVLEGFRSKGPLIQYHARGEDESLLYNRIPFAVGVPHGPRLPWAEFSPDGETFVMHEVSPLGGDVSVKDSALSQIDNPDFHVPHGYNVDATAFFKRFGQFYWKLLAAAEAEVPVVEPLALAEALKARVISKGPPLTYTALKPLQRFMWSVLSRHPTFVLTGTPVTAQIVERAMGKKIKDGEVYVSGDYKDATNELESWASEAAVDAISSCLELSVAERRLFRRALTEHVFEDEKGNWLPQINGQLMGSVVSFPVLCIVNAAISRFAMEQATCRKRMLRDLPLLINGDDVVFRGPRESYDLWKRATSLVGLSESIGKTYVSDAWLNINSTNFRRQADSSGEVIRPVRVEARGSSYDRTCAFYQVPFVNVGLLFGQKRSGGVSDVSNVVGRGGRDMTFGQTSRELADVAPIGLVNELLTRFVGIHCETLQKIRVPWFMPEWMGGVGLPAFFNTRRLKHMGPTEEDLAKGAFIFTNTLDQLRLGKESEWRIHQHVMERLPERPLSVPLVHPRAADFDDRFSRVYGFEAASLLFDSELDLKALLRKPRERAAVESLRANERLWAKALPLPGVAKRLGARLTSAAPDVVSTLPIGAIQVATGNTIRFV